MPSFESHIDEISRDFEKFSPRERHIADGEMQCRLALRIFGGDGKSIDEIMMDDWTKGKDCMSKRFRDLLEGHPHAGFLKRYMTYSDGKFDTASCKSRIQSKEPGTFEQEQVLDEIEQLLRDEVPNSPS